MSRTIEPPPRATRRAEVYATPTAGRSPSDDDYAAFGNVPTRNGLQARVEIPLMLWTLQIPRGGRVLEVGCGRGVALPVLSARLAPASLTGIDVDAALVAEAERRVAAARVPNADVLHADVRALPFDDASFDLVIDFGTCYHVSGGIAGSLAALREIARVLRPGGLFVHETRVAQHLAHPVRAFGRTVPWMAEPALVPDRAALLWSVRRRRVARA